MSENLKPLRWIATVTYRTDSGPTEVNHAFQELDELADIIEAGPNWKRAYPAQPGTGPEGETCKTCEHLHRNRQAKVYLKCWKMQTVWTGGGGSDVKARAPACSQWQANKLEEGE